MQNSYAIRAIALVQFLLVITAASKFFQSNFLVPAQFQLNTVSLSELTVNENSDLEWTLQSSQLVQANDCIVFEMPNPYHFSTETDFYQSFEEAGVTACNFISEHEGQCEVLGNQTFKISFSAPSTSRKIVGSTSSKPFRNPYSTRRINSFIVQLYKNCTTSNEPSVSGFTQNTNTFIPGVIQSHQVKLVSDSQVIGVTDANLNLRFTPSTEMPKKGTISLRVPNWYKAASTEQGAPFDEYMGTVLDFYSQVTLKSDQPLTMSTRFDQNSQTVSVSYESPVRWRSEVQLEFSNFKNPISQRALGGFQVVTADSFSFIIDKTYVDVALETIANQVQKLQYSDFTLLGDQNGENVGRVGSLNTVQIMLGVPFPLEPFCVFQFKLPSQLQMQTDSLLGGTGIFQPESGRSAYSYSNFQYNKDTQVLTVVGCLTPTSFNSKPFGSLDISNVLLPSYITAANPIGIKVYSDKYMDDLIISNPESASMKPEQMSPGSIDLQYFRPTSSFAQATDVSYKIQIELENGLQVESRMLIQMPPHLTFNNSCELIQFRGICQLDSKTNLVTITDMVLQVKPGPSLIKIIIKSGNNPKGARQSGPWSVETQVPAQDGTYYTVDYNLASESFYAQAGYIISQIQIDLPLNFAIDSTYSFELLAEHDIPVGGKLFIELPQQMSTTDETEVSGLTLVEYSIQKITLSLPLGSKKEEKLSCIITGIRNPRSFQPSDAFKIYTTDNDDYIIDLGENTNAVMDKMSKFSSFEIVAENKTNGHAGVHKVKFHSALPIMTGDILILTVPPEMSVEAAIFCSGNASGIVSVTCTGTATTLRAQFSDVNQEAGNFTFFIDGIKNPPSFKPSSSYQDIYLTDSDGYYIQNVADYTNLYVQTEAVALIYNYTQSQSSQQYGEDSQFQLTVIPVNPIPQNGYIEIFWPNEVIFYPGTACSIQTSKQITNAEFCTIDLATKTVKVNGVFEKQYNGPVSITFSRLTNPVTNKNLSPFTLKTYTNSQKQFPIDELVFFSLLECDYPCRYCGDEKDYCLKCWPGENNIFLQRSGAKSICQASCDAGFTTDGDPDLVCSHCDPSCARCADEGQAGDVRRCTECAVGFDYQDPITRFCIGECPYGSFDQYDGTCGLCSSSCGSCLNQANNCTSCNTDMEYPVLFENQCVKQCPDGFASTGGLCVPCQSPCETCSTSPQSCKTCDGSLNRNFKFGPLCLAECPQGTTTDSALSVCYGCTSGCMVCDEQNPTICRDCNHPLLLHEDKCVTACPTGTRANFKNTFCRLETALDANFVYFPIIQLILVLLAISWVGKCVKPSHLILPNFLIMMSLLEHLSLIAQVVLAFVYSSIVWGVLSLCLWCAYASMLILFFRLFKNQVIDQDRQYKKWLRNPKNRFISWVMSLAGGLITWRFYKLLYSHFFGYKVKTTDFDDQKKFQQVMYKPTILTICLVYAPLILVNSIFLALITHDNQLYIQLIENIVQALVMTACSLVEHKLMPTYQTRDEVRRQKQQEQIKVLSTLEEPSDLTMTKTFAKVQDRTIFTNLSVEELLQNFGGRICQSMGDLWFEKENDPRLNRTYPLSPKVLIQVDDPPCPMGPMLLDNCYHEPKEREELNMHNLMDGNWRNKAIQCGGPFEDDLHRRDARIMTNQDTTSPVPTLPMIVGSKKQRGRRNRYFTLIDREDYEAGTIPDSDEEINTLKVKTKADRLRAILELEELQVDEILTQRVDAKQSQGDQSCQPGTDPQFLPVKESNARSSYEQNLSNRNRNVQALMSQSYDRGSLANTQDNRFNFSPTPSLSRRAEINGSIGILLDTKTRWFNEIDIVGEFERNKKGDPILHRTSDGVYLDNKQRIVTKQGYLLDPNGNVIHNQLNHVVFRDINEDLPAPFSLERYNFNPFEIIGYHNSFKDVSNAQSFIINKESDGLWVDGQRRPMNFQGFLVDQAGNLVRPDGSIVFKTWQLREGGIPTLFTYDNKQFCILDVIGCFTKIDGSIPKAQKDQSGRTVNERGYLVTREGHVCNRAGQVLFEKETLKGGEFPKLFQFSKLPTWQFIGDLEFDELGELNPIQNRLGNLEDRRGRLVNKKGFLIDSRFNVIDTEGNIMFERGILNKDDGLPEFYRKQLERDSD